MVGKNDNSVDTDYPCQNCDEKKNITSYNFLVPIGKYFFCGNADAATNRDFAGKKWNSKMKKLKSWKSDIYKFG